MCRPLHDITKVGVFLLALSYCHSSQNQSSSVLSDCLEGVSWQSHFRAFCNPVWEISFVGKPALKKNYLGEQLVPLISFVECAYRIYNPLNSWGIS